MATSGRPRFSALDHPTRQQLDELDALMQRMLALPVNPVEESPDPELSEGTGVPAPSPTGTEVAVPPPLVAAPGSSGESIAENGPAASQPELSGTPAVVLGTKNTVPSTDFPVPRPPYPVAISPPSVLGTRYSVLGTPPIAAPHSATLVPPARSPAMPEVTAQPPRLAWPLRPLFWLTLAFDSGTAWLGPFGRWLRGPSGRAVLGWGGLLLLAAALAWVAWDGMAWSW